MFWPKSHKKLFFKHRQKALKKTKPYQREFSLQKLGLPGLDLEALDPAQIVQLRAECLLEEEGPRVLVLVLLLLLLLLVTLGRVGRLAQVAQATLADEAARAVQEQEAAVVGEGVQGWKGAEELLVAAHEAGQVGFGDEGEEASAASHDKNLE